MCCRPVGMGNSHVLCGVHGMCCAVLCLKLCCSQWLCFQSWEEMAAHSVCLLTERVRSCVPYTHDVQAVRLGSRWPDLPGHGDLLSDKCIMQAATVLPELLTCRVRNMKGPASLRPRARWHYQRVPSTHPLTTSVKWDAISALWYVCMYVFLYRLARQQCACKYVTEPMVGPSDGSCVSGAALPMWLRTS